MKPEEIRDISIKEVPFHGGFRPENALDEGFQPEGNHPVPSSIPTLVSAIVPPDAGSRPPTSPTGLISNDDSPQDE